MRILHTADLHLGQILYQNYSRTDEHEHFFRQLEEWCRQYQPDALVVSGDVFDIQQPSASVKEFFTRTFVKLRDVCPGMRLVVTAGNHDSATRLEAEAALWKCINAHIIGTAPSPTVVAAADGWQEHYIVRMPAGYIAAFPYMSGNRREVIQSVLDYISRENSDNKPVVITGHLALSSADVTGHNFEIGKIATQSMEDMGSGFDYLALGHIHRPQTLGYPIEDESQPTSSYPPGTARYAGSALHVSCDEKYPHTVSLVDLPAHGADVTVTRLRIDELRHFYELPGNGTPVATADDVLRAIAEFSETTGRGYFRLRIPFNVALPADFDQQVYKILEAYKEEVRYNPKTVWLGEPTEAQSEKPVFEVAELQEMDDPLQFIEKTIDQYPELSLDELREAFKDVTEEIRKMEEEQNRKP